MTLGKSLYLPAPQAVKIRVSGAQREGPFWIHSRCSLTPLMATINQVLSSSSPCQQLVVLCTKRATLVRMGSICGVVFIGDPAPVRSHSLGGVQHRVWLCLGAGRQVGVPQNHLCSPSIFPWTNTGLSG